MYIIQRSYPENSEYRDLGFYEDFPAAEHALDWYRKHTSGQYRIVTTEDEYYNSWYSD